ncbi:hypothetical protein ACLMJK_008015 [Lecanora helva]
MPLSSLSNMARRACVKNLRSIIDVGDTPYNVIRPVLMKLENPAQLKQIEDASPQIIGHDEEIWMEFIKRDVPNWDKKPHQPADPKNWYKVYQKLLRESQKDIQRDAELLKATIDGINQEKSKHRIHRVELDRVKVADDMKKCGPTIRMPSSVKFIDRWDLHDSVPPTQKQLKIERGELDPNAPKRSARPKSKLDHIRNNVAHMPRFQNQPKPATGIIRASEMASKQVPAKATVLRAPRAMIEEHRKAAAPQPLDRSIQPAPVFNPKKRKIEHVEGPVDALAEREKRLKAFTNPPSSATATPTIKTPRSRPSALGTSSLPSSSTSHNAQPHQSRSPSSSSPQSQSTPDSSPPQQTQATPDTSPPLKPANKDPSEQESQLPRAGTASPTNGSTLPPKIMKRKQPADIFMRPNKRTRAR